MRILISGAGGFLGSKFVEKLDKPENSIMAVDNMQSPYAIRPPMTYGQFFREDIREYIRYRIWKPFDVMYHFAAPVGGREKIEGDPMFNAESINIDNAVIRWAAQGNVKLLVYPSSSAVYPVGLQTKYVSQRLAEHDFKPWDATWMQPDEMYGFTKMVGEITAFRASQVSDLKVYAIRPFSGYGEGQSLEYPFPSLMQRIARGDDPVDVWGDGSQVRDFIHVDDIVDHVVNHAPDFNGFNYAMENLGSGEGTSFNELIQRAAKIAGYQPIIRAHTDKPVGVHYRVSQDRIPQNVSLDEGIARMLSYERKRLHG